MTRGIKECPKCNKPNGTRAKTCIECGFDFTLPQEYDGPGTEKQAPEEKPEEPIMKCDMCDCDTKSGKERFITREGVLCIECFKKVQAEKLVPVEVPTTRLMRESRVQVPDTKTKPTLLFTIDFPDNTDWKLIDEVCDPFVQDGYSCTLRGCRIFEFRK